MPVFSIQELNLRNNRLAALSPEIGQLTALETLDLGGNYLTALPPQIGQLRALQVLNLSHNSLTTIPSEIGYLTALQELDLSSNQLTAIPSEIGQLTVLQSFYITNNQLTTLPPEIGQLTALFSLDLYENLLTELPSEIGQLMGLQRLHLIGNQLTALPPEIGQLTSLRALFLTDNRLTAIPPEIGQLAGLVHLTLNGNQLNTLPPEIGQLTSLRALFLTDNQLTTIPPGIGRLNALQEINFSGNQFTELPPEIHWLTALQIPDDHSHLLFSHIPDDEIRYSIDGLHHCIDPHTFRTYTRLDAAVPEQVYLQRAFDVAAAVRLPDASLLTEDDLTQVKFSDAYLFWPESKEYVRLRIKVEAPECQIIGRAHYTFLLAHGRNSPVFYFHLIPKQTGNITVIVTLSQEKLTLGNTRVRTTAVSQVAGEVHFAIKSESSVVDYTPITDNFPGLPPSLHRHLRTAFLTSPFFESNASLFMLFADARIAPWRADLPATATLNQRALTLINHLYPQTNSQGENALALFLHVMADNTDPADSLHRELMELAYDLTCVPMI